MENIIYHITTLSEWKNAQAIGWHETASLATEGFIHCCTSMQAEGMLQRYFTGKTDLVKLTIDASKLTSALLYELSPSVNEKFPHIYGRLNLDAVIATEEIAI